MTSFKNKNAIMSLAAMQILLFHLWIRMWPAVKAEQFLIATAYVGVDIFFFVSAFAIGRKAIPNYGKYVVGKVEHIYVSYIIFTLIACAYGTVKWDRFLPIITTQELFTKGGGAFLWYLPAAMLVYILLPLYQKLCLLAGKAAKGSLTWIVPVIALGIWYAIGVYITEQTKEKGMFIYWNRIPVIILGYHAPQLLGILQKAAEGRDGNTKSTGNVLLWMKLAAGIIITAIGFYLLYRYGFQPPLRKPIRDMFYVVGIPATVGLILICDFIPKNPVTDLIGQSTMEMYAVQMIFGYKVAGELYKRTKSAPITNLVTILFVVIVAILFMEVRKRVSRAGNKADNKADK